MKAYFTVWIMQCHTVSVLLRQVMRHDSHLMLIKHAYQDALIAATACYFYGIPGLTLLLLVLLEVLSSNPSSPYSTW